MRINKFVLDANVWISYFITQKEKVLADYIVENRISIFVCDELLIELKRVLAYPHLKQYSINIKEAVYFVQDIGVHFELNYPIKNLIPEDEDDNYVIALALQTNSGFITSGDKHILLRKDALETKYKKLRILTKNEFERMMKAK